MKKVVLIFIVIMFYMIGYCGLLIATDKSGCIGELVKNIAMLFYGALIAIPSSVFWYNFIKGGFNKKTN